MGFGIQDIDLQLVLLAQQLHPTFDWFFIAISEIGGTVATLLLFPLVYWVVDREKGLELCYVLLATMVLVGFFKGLFEFPRPFVVSSNVKAIMGASGYSFPSGHAASTVVYCGFIALVFKSTWLYYMASFLILTMSISRVYLGVHFPTDVLAGMILGCFILKMDFILRDKINKIYETCKDKLMLFLLIMSLIFLFLPFVAKQTYVGVAIFLGMSISQATLARVGFINFTSMGARLKAYTFGMVVLVVLFYGLSYFFKYFSINAVVSILITGVLMGFWVHHYPRVLLQITKYVKE